MARSNGGIVGKKNITSFGGNTITRIASSSNHTTQPGTTIVQTAIVSGGGGGGYD